MGRMGGSSVDKTNFSALLGKGSGPVSEEKDIGTKKLPGQKEKRVYQKGVRFTPREAEQFELFKQALGTDQDTVALLRCFTYVWEQFGPEIKEIAAKKEKMKVL